MYYIHGAFLAKYDSPLFISPLEHGPYGVGYPIVAKEYLYNLNEPLSNKNTEEPNLNINNEQKNLIHLIIKKKIPKNIFQLVNDNCQESPLQKTKNTKIIPDGLVKEYFLSDEGRKHYEE